MKKLDITEVKALLVMVTGFAILSYFFRVKENILAADTLFYIAIGIGVISLLIPIAGYYIVWFWYKIGMVLGWVNSRIILTALFYLFLFPIALFSRIFNKDTLKLRKGSGGPEGKGSLYTVRDYQYEAKDLENMW